jgi:uncharacterized membrane-anchored protein
MRRHQIFAAALCAVLFVGVVEAQGPKGLGSTREEFEAKLGYQSGTVTLKGGMATIQLPDSFRFLGPEGAKRLLVEAWGNPEEMADDVLGMLIPTSASPLSQEGWGVVITYDQDGYVNDSDAAGINYDKLLREMQEGAIEANEERKKQGFDTVTIMGWAEPPSYDAASHKMYWAKDLLFSGNTEHTLNYNIRILGRRGVLVLNAVASMSQLDAIRKETQNVLSAVEFNEGHRYTDYLPGTDKAAAYGLAGLVLGAGAAKAGLFKMLWVGLLAFKKVVVAGIVALVAFIRRLFGGKAKTAPARA